MSAQGPPYDDENDPQDPLPPYDDGDQKPGESNDAYAARVTAAREAMQIERKVSRIGVDQWQEFERQHRERMNPYHQETFDQAYYDNWIAQRGARRLANTNRRANGLAAAQQWDVRHGYDPTLRTAPVRADGHESGDDQFDDENLEAEFPVPLAQQAINVECSRRQGIPTTPVLPNSSSSPTVLESSTPTARPVAAARTAGLICLYCKGSKKGCTATVAAPLVPRFPVRSS